MSDAGFFERMMAAPAATHTTATASEPITFASLKAMMEKIKPPAPAPDRLILRDGKAYLIDTSSLHKMFEPMPILTPVLAPSNLELTLHMCTDLMPQVVVPQAAFIICDSFGPDPDWTFVYLFPLGKRAYAKRRSR